MNVSEAEKPVLDDAAECGDAVLPVDLLAFLVAAWGVGDGDLPGARMQTGDLKCEFRLESEAVFIQFDFLQEFAADHLVAAFHIGEREIGEHVAKAGQKLVDL